MPEVKKVQRKLLPSGRPILRVISDCSLVTSWVCWWWCPQLSRASTTSKTTSSHRSDHSNNTHMHNPTVRRMAVKGAAPLERTV